MRLLTLAEVEVVLAGRIVVEAAAAPWQWSLAEEGGLGSHLVAGAGGPVQPHLALQWVARESLAGSQHPEEVAVVVTPFAGQLLAGAGTEVPELEGMWSAFVQPPHHVGLPPQCCCHACRQYQCQLR